MVLTGVTLGNPGPLKHPLELEPAMAALFGLGELSSDFITLNNESSRRYVRVSVIKQRSLSLVVPV